jgi:hypothetical protein
VVVGFALAVVTGGPLTLAPVNRRRHIHTSAPRQAASATMQDTSRLAQARTDCGTEYGSEGELTEGHDGQVTLVIDTGGSGYDAGYGTAYDVDYDEMIEKLSAVYCVLETLGAPDSVIPRIDRTRALDGTQDAEWDEFTASWTYHPDDGRNLIITEN